MRITQPFFIMGLIALIAFSSTSAAQAVTLSGGSVKVVNGSSTTLDISLDNVPTGLSGYNVSVAIADPVVAQITGISFPSWVGVHQDSGADTDSVWMKGVDLARTIESGSTGIILGSLTMRGDQTGLSAVVITVTKLDDDAGGIISPTIVPGQIKVIPRVVILPGQAALPTDPASDDLYEDLNGNGRIDFNDVVLYFNHIEWIEVSEPVPYFDYNGNTRIDFDDVVDLFWGI